MNFRGLVSRRIPSRWRFFVLGLCLVGLLVPLPAVAHESVDAHPVHQEIVRQAYWIWPWQSGNGDPAIWVEFNQYLEGGYLPGDPEEDPFGVAFGDGIVEGAQEEDFYSVILGQFSVINPDGTEQLNPDYWGAIENFSFHFWDPDVGLDAGYGNSSSAYRVARMYIYGGTDEQFTVWDPFEGFEETKTRSLEGAISLYARGEKGLAYYYLGRAAHLLADMAVPAHVHRDPHPCGWGWALCDHYEHYVGENCAPGPANCNAWVADGTEQVPDYDDLFLLFYDLSQITQYVASDGFDGNTVDEVSDGLSYPEWSAFQSNWGLETNVCEVCDPDDLLIGDVADTLMPLAFRYTASLYQLFWNETHPPNPAIVVHEESGTAADDVLEFGSPVVGTSVVQSFTIHNGGTADLQVGSWLSNHPAFTLSPANPYGTIGDVVISPQGAPVTVEVTFTPSVAGPYAGIIGIASNDPNVPVYELSVVGTAVDSGASIEVTASPNPVVQGSEAEISAVVRDAYGDPVGAGETVSFSSPCDGSWAPGEVVTTNSFGVAETVFTPAESGACVILAERTTTGHSGSTILNVDSGDIICNVVVQLGECVPDVSQVYLHRATVTYTDGSPVNQQPVQWSVSEGQILSYDEQTDIDGEADLQFRIVNSDQRTVTVTLTTGGSSCASTHAVDLNCGVSYCPAGRTIPVGGLQMDVTPSGSKLAVAHGERVRLLDLQTEQWCEEYYEEQILNGLTDIAINESGTHIGLSSNYRQRGVLSATCPLPTDPVFPITPSEENLRAGRAVIWVGNRLLMGHSLNSDSSRQFSLYDTSATLLDSEPVTFDSNDPVAELAQRPYTSDWAAVSDESPGSHNWVFFGSVSGNSIQVHNHFLSPFRNAGVGWSADGSLLVVGSSITEAQLAVYQAADLGSGSPSYTTVTLGYGARYIAFSDDDAYLAVAGEDSPVVWLYDTSAPGPVGWTELCVIQFDQACRGLAWLPGGHVLLAQGAGQVQFANLDDDTAPTVVIASPSNGDEFVQDFVLVSGQATDAYGVQYARIRVNQAPWQDLVLDGVGNFTHQVNLAPGANAITVEAVDDSGWSGYDTVTVTRLVDNTAPVVSNAMASPASTARPGTLVGLSATVTDDMSGVDVSSVSAHVQRPDETDVDVVTLSPTSGDEFGGNWDTSTLGSGVYQVDILASDLEGNSGETENAVAVELNEAPVVELTAPSGATSLYVGQSYTLSWTTSDIDSAAITSLYLDTDQDPADGLIPITGGLALAENVDTLILNTAEYQAGAYYVYAFACDEYGCTGDWATGSITTEVRPGDLDLDGNVDLADFQLFAGCMRGPDIPYTSGCESGALDEDGDIDLADYANFALLVAEPPPDMDGDGIPDEDDNCPSDANTDQADFDTDGLGDVCDPDDDNDDDPDDSDCEPLDPAVHHGATEVCDDGVDNDCDGYTDGDDPDCSFEPRLWLYWADPQAHKIQRKDLESGEVVDLVHSLDEPRGIALDFLHDWMFWTDRALGIVQRAHLDGSGVETIMQGLSDPRDVAVDLQTQVLFISDYGTGLIHRASLDGTGHQSDFISGLGSPLGIAITPTTGHMYIAEHTGNRISRVGLDGLNLQTVIGGLTPMYLAVGSDNIYWTSQPSPDGVLTAALDGSGQQTLTTIPHAPQGIVLDEIGGELYWSDPGTRNVIERMSLADQNIVQVHSSVHAIGIALLRDSDGDGDPDDSDCEPLDPAVNHGATEVCDDGVDNDCDGYTDGEDSDCTEVAWVYWTDSETDKIYRIDATTPGAVPEALLSGLSTPWGIAIDKVGGMIYWSEVGTGEIKRADLDFQAAEVIVGGLSQPYGLALDLVNGKIYWADHDHGTGAIGTANLDGTAQNHNLITGQTNLYDVALDVSGGKMYWQQYGQPGSLHRANLDGTGTETVLQSNPVYLTIGNGKIYWSHQPDDGIKWADLDGNNIDYCVSSLVAPNDVELGVINGQSSLFWTDPGADKIEYATWDGLNRQTLYGGTDAAHARELALR